MSNLPISIPLADLIQCRNLGRIQEKASDQISQKDNDSTMIERNTRFRPKCAKERFFQIQTHIRPATLKFINLKISLQNVLPSHALPDERCFVSLTDILNTSFLNFGNTTYCITPSNTFVPICNFAKPISATQCFVETNDIVIDPIPEYFNDNISLCDSNAYLTCNSFISDQSFKSNLTGRTYKIQTYEQLTCGSSNVVYAIHYVQCGLMYVSETGRSLQSRINGHRSGITKDSQSLFYKHLILPGHSLNVPDMKVQILEKIYHCSENPANIRLH